MAALLLSFAGAGLGSTLFGTFGAAAGRIIGSAFGGVIDRALFGGKATRHVEGPRLDTLQVMGSTEGAAIPRVYGRARLAGQVIWATELEEVVTTKEEDAGGGKGGGPKVATTTYTYFANFAVGLCAGPIARIGRIWADGKPLDLANLTVRFHLGAEDQLPDTLIEAKEGEGNAPSYRGLAYIAFERLPLESFGNRLPQISVEVMRPVGRLERMVRAVTIIPGATEFGYDPNTVTRLTGSAIYTPENRHVMAGSDWNASLDELQAVCPNLERVALVVAWFGSDLRAGECTVRPGVDNADKSTNGAEWSVAGLARGDAYVVTQIDGRAAFGGTPSDASVVRAIEDLKARGLKVTFYPFVMMDVASDNTLPDPWTGAASQPAFPWRGRITCDPAPGEPGTPDGTAAAATQVASLFGTAAPGDFSLEDDEVIYSGPTEWTLRRMVLHYAELCVAAGGVDDFIIGSEFEALTRVRAAAGVYPAVTQLVSLAADVRTVLGVGTKISYAANWTEYGAHVIDSNEVRFPLDPLWASSAIDFVGIDYYAPLSDWRDGDHLDGALAETIYDLGYLRGNLSAGEAYDFYYADAAARQAQTRSPISDGLAKPWMFRAKDLWNWWAEPHVERVAGAELGAPTAWVPQSKPIRFTEVGCPAVDKGANEPNVFPDARSSEGGFPHFSNRRRDDLIQRRYLEAVIGKFDPAFGAGLSDNPLSPLYGGRMLDPAGVALWTWDARPYPAFPLALDVWSDGANWQTGHWLTGRLGAAPMDDLVAAVLADHEIGDCEVDELRGAVDGYVIDRPIAARGALEPLALAFAFDAIEDGNLVRFRPRGGPVVAVIDDGDLVADGDKPECRLVRAQETELPVQIAVAFTEIKGDYRRAAALSRRLVGESRREARAELAAVMDDAVAERAADILLQDLWAGREKAEFALPPSRLALVPGDVVSLTVRDRTRLFEITEAVDALARAIQARTIDPEIFTVPARAPRRVTLRVPPASGPPAVLVLDLPTLDDEAEPLQYFAVFTSPWPRAIAVWRGSGLGYQRVALAAAPATVGETLDDIGAGAVHRWDHKNSFRVRLASGALASFDDARVLGGTNAAAIRGPAGWEVIQFASAELVAEDTYLLTRLLRGQLGTEAAIGNPTPAGAPFVVLDRALVPVAKSVDLLGRSFSYRVGRIDADVADPAMTAVEATVGPVALLPWSPAHVRGTRAGDGVHLSWVRRTRRGGDSWEALEVPLGEASERYRVEILSGTTVKRTLETTAPAALYAAADETADFGAPQSSLGVRVAQLSAVVGAGTPRAATLTL